MLNDSSVIARGANPRERVSVLNDSSVIARGAKCSMAGTVTWADAPLLAWAVGVMKTGVPFGCCSPGRRFKRRTAFTAS